MESNDHVNELVVLRVIGRYLRARIVQGLLLALPIAITFFIVHWLYRSLRELVIDPVAVLVVWTSNRLAGESLSENPLPWWFESYAAPAIAVAVVIVVLYLLGTFFQSRLHRTVDWLMLKAPLVNTVYSAVRKVFATFEGQQGMERFKRVVLVAFPHPGMRVPGFVTSSCRDISTGECILCVYVPTTPVPTSGYMLLVPESEVLDLNWNVNDTLQAIVSGGITVPDTVDYFPNGRLAAAEGVS